MCINGYLYRYLYMDFYLSRKHTYINTLVSSGTMFMLMLLSRSVARWLLKCERGHRHTNTHSWPFWLFWVNGYSDPLSSKEEAPNLVICVCIKTKQKWPLQLEMSMVVLAEATLKVLQLPLWVGWQRTKFKQEAPFTAGFPEVAVSKWKFGSDLTSVRWVCADRCADVACASATRQRRFSMWRAWKTWQRLQPWNFTLALKWVWGTLLPSTQCSSCNSAAHWGRACLHIIEQTNSISASNKV